jgi:hypothetical protein
MRTHRTLPTEERRSGPSSCGRQIDRVLTFMRLILELDHAMRSAFVGRTHRER